MTILIAEDAPIDAIILKNILEHAGNRVIVVRDGEAALAALEEHPEIGLVVADVRMPEMDGVGLLRIMRDRPDLSTIPVVFVSSAADAETVKEALALSPAGYVLKPLNEPSRILDRVGHALRDVPALLADEADVRRAHGLDADGYREARENLAASLRASLARSDDRMQGLDEMGAQAQSVGALRLLSVIQSERPHDPALIEREMRAALHALSDSAA